MLKQAIDRLRARDFEKKYGLPKLKLDDLVRSDLTIDLRGWNADKRAGDFADSLVICAVAQTVNPKLYWEIGTGDGRTSLLVARNTSADAQIMTLDPRFPDDPIAGRVFRGTPEAAKIKQFGALSSKFDFTPWHGKTDLVFVDGGHDFEDVAGDSIIAFNLVAPSGWILWHDVAIDSPGVPMALMASSHARHIKHIQGTRYAIYRNSGEGLCSN